MRFRDALACLAAIAGAGCAHHARGAAPEVSIAPPGTGFLAADTARARTAGAGPAVVVASGASAPGDSIGGRIEATSDTCVVFLARGGPTLDDVDLFVYADDGAALGTDEAPSAQASLVVCPPHPRHLYAFARVAAGHGLLAVSAQFVSPRDADRVANVVSARGRLTASTGPENLWGALEDALAAHRREVGGTWHDVRRVAVPLDPRTPTLLSAAVDPGQCLDLFSEPGEDVAFTELSVLDSDGRILAEVPAERRQPTVVVCSPARAEVTFSLRPHAGRGLALAVLSVASDVKAPADGVVVYPSETLPLDAAITALGSELGDPQAAHLLARGSAKVARRDSLDVELAPGCARLDVVGGNPVRGISAFLWADDGNLIAHSEGSSRATLFACTATRRRVRLDVEATARAGSFAVLSRKIETSSPSLSAEPLAASRLLGLLSHAPKSSSPPEIETMTLASNALARRETPLSGRECVTAAIGLGPSGMGAELRVVDAGSGEELSLSTGTYGTSVDTCAADRPLRLRFESRVHAGSTTALIALSRRTVTPRP